MPESQNKKTLDNNKNTSCMEYEREKEDLEGTLNFAQDALWVNSGETVVDVAMFLPDCGEIVVIQDISAEDYDASENGESLSGAEPVELNIKEQDTLEKFESSTSENLISERIETSHIEKEKLYLVDDAPCLIAETIPAQGNLLKKSHNISHLNKLSVSMREDKLNTSASGQDSDTGGETDTTGEQISSGDGGQNEKDISAVKKGGGGSCKTNDSVHRDNNAACIGENESDKEQQSCSTEKGALHIACKIYCKEDSSMTECNATCTAEDRLEVERDVTYAREGPLQVERDATCGIKYQTHLGCDAGGMDTALNSEIGESDVRRDKSQLALSDLIINQDAPAIMAIVNSSSVLATDINKLKHPEDTSAIFKTEREALGRDTSLSCVTHVAKGLKDKTATDIEQVNLEFVEDTLCVIADAMRLNKETLDKSSDKPKTGAVKEGEVTARRATSYLENHTAEFGKQKTQRTMKKSLNQTKRTAFSRQDQFHIPHEFGCMAQDAQYLEREKPNSMKQRPVLTQRDSWLRNNDHNCVLELNVQSYKNPSRSCRYLVMEDEPEALQDNFFTIKVPSDIEKNTSNTHAPTFPDQDRFRDSSKYAGSQSLSTPDTEMGVVVKTHPDGGWGWVVCLCAFLVQFIALGTLNTAGIVYTELVKELKTPRGATAWVGSLATGIMFLLGPLTTSLCERFGCRIVTTCGAMICITGLLLSSFTTSLITLYLTYGVIFGSGTSLCYFPTIVVLSKYFKRRIAVVNGLVTAGSGVGTLVIGPAAQMLFLRFGVANTFRIMAGIFSLLIVCGAMYRPVPPKYSLRHKSTETRRYFDWSIFKNKGYLIWVSSLGTFQLGYFVPFVHLVRHAEDLGIDATKASFLIGYMSVAATVGRLIVGKLAGLSCVNRMRMYQTGLFGIALCSFLVPLSTGYGGLTAYAVTFGFFEACFVLLIPLITSDIVGLEKMSYALGSAFTVMAFPMFLGPPIAGWIYDFAGDYAVAFYSCGGTSAVAACLVFFVPIFTTIPYEKHTEDQPNSPNRKTPTNRWQLCTYLRFLFGCTRKGSQTTKSFDNIQYSVIITTDRMMNV